MNALDGLNVGRMHLRNRIIRSATHEGMTDDNCDPDERLIDLYTEFANGDVGAIITGYAGVRQDGKAPTPNMMMFDDDSHIPPYSKVTERMKELGVPIILQIAHCGRQTREKVTGLPTVAPSAIKDWLYNEAIPHELTSDEIADVVDAFVNAAVRAEKAGFDGVQVHAAHGYLLSSFLSPHMNKRKDEWGGSTENRFRIVRMIAEGIRQRTDIPMLIKINCFEKSKDGIRTEEAVRIAKLAESAGFDAIEVSCGIMEEGMVMCRGDIPIDTFMKTNFRMTPLPNFVKPLIKPYIRMKMKSPEPTTLYNVDAAEEIKRNVSILVIAVGGIRKFSDIDDIVEKGRCDAVSMSRPFVIEPDIVKRFKDGQERSSCIECNKCLARAEGHVLRCYSRS